MSGMTCAENPIILPSSNIPLWAYKHGKKIWTIAVKETQRMQLYPFPFNIPDYDIRGISELPDCNSFKKIYKLLPGFEVVYMDKGRLYISPDNPHGFPSIVINHTFALNQETGEIADFAFAQALKKNDGTYHCPGDRIKRLHKLAPELITPLRQGFALLYGTRGEIMDKLGFEYCIEKETA
jgi:hypothetical protein